MIQQRLKAYVMLGSTCLAMQATAAPAEVTPETIREAGAPSESASASARFEPAHFELGLFGGVFFPSSSHELLSRGPFSAYEAPAPELGARSAAYPLRFLGVELEGSAMSTETSRGGDPAGIWAARAHLVLQLPLGQILPIAVIGAGALGAGSNSLGTDMDPAFHFGLGVKLALDDFLSIRVDLRDTLAQKQAAAQGVLTHFPEALLGIGFSLREALIPKPPDPELPKDRDQDGLLDAADACPEEPGPRPSGCPIEDLDGDSLPDERDVCPKAAGLAPCGCPPQDADGDKIIDELDRCPNEPGPIDGCPDPDADHDGIPMAADTCPEKPETKNDFEDADGCPDEVPERVQQFTGVIEGIQFERGKETIRAVSTPTLEEAARVLEEYATLRVLITGHTDADGNRVKNLDLSKRRAEAVKAYFVGRGIDPNRIETRGEGPNQPVADNETALGKQKNRRIEFELIDEAKSPEKGQP